ncbi:hypothetical protein CBS147372_9614 [Penicillium roqueforti]|nr:hypothetical protein CBS147372_9614 [Penicillium roqueforti]
MSRMDWEYGNTELPIHEAQINPALPPDGSQVLAKNLTGVQPSIPLDLKFVNLSHPDDVRRQKEIRTEIRRHVMKDIGQRRRRPRRKEKETSPPATRVSSTESKDSEVPQLCGTTKSRVSPGRSLTVLGNFPIEADMRVLELMHFLNAAPYQPFKGVWIEIALCDPGAFHVTLGNAADFLNKIKGNESPIKSPEVLSHYTASTKQLRRRLSNVEQGISEGAIANILAHVCLAMRTYDWNSWTVYMNGLSLVEKLRGGFANLGHSTSLAILLYDLAGAMIFDSSPRFSLPVDLISKSNESLRGVLSRLQALLLQLYPPTIAPAGEALRMISSLANVINTNSHSASFWKKDTKAISLMGPCIHFLLSMPRIPNNFETMADREDLIAREIVRLVCLVLMSRLKEAFAFPATERVSLQTRFAEIVSQNITAIGEKYFDLKIWALVTGALLQRRDEKGLHGGEIHRVLRTVDTSKQYDVLEITREIVWIDILMSPFTDELAEDMALHGTFGETY